MPRKNKTKAEKISSIPIEEIVSLKGKEGREKLESYVKTLRFGYKRRVQSFSRKKLVSHAQIALEGTLPPGKQVPLTKMTRNQLILEFARYSRFFQGKTSSEEGIKEINYDQDKRIFGVSYNGKPRNTMTYDERVRFWSLYEEFQNQNPTANSRFGSESVQQMLAEVMFSGREGASTIVELLDKVEEKLMNKYTEENMRSVPNVYSGRGNFTPE